MQLGMRLSNVLTTNRRSNLQDKASKLQRVLDVMQAELTEGEAEKDEYSQIATQRRLELNKVEDELTSLENRLVVLE